MVVVLVVGGDGKKPVKLGFWQCLHVHGKLIKQPIKPTLAGSSSEKKLRCRGTFEAKALKKMYVKFLARKNKKVPQQQLNATKNAFRERKYEQTIRVSDIIGLQLYRLIQELEILLKISVSEVMPKYEFLNTCTCVDSLA